jgi:hypothetical protein
MLDRPGTLSGALMVTTLKQSHHLKLPLKLSDPLAYRSSEFR